MKVILIKDVARLGRKSEVKDVPSGHALNFLIPRKLAVIATPEQLRRHTVEAKQIDVQKEHARETFLSACAVLAEAHIPYRVDANEQGHLFKGIHAEDILALLKAEKEIVLTKKNILLDHPIKELGTYTIPLTLEDVKGVCTIDIIRK